jgi:hypothetical protein
LRKGAKMLDALNEYVLNTVLCPNAITEKDVEHWIQYSIDTKCLLALLLSTCGIANTKMNWRTKKCLQKTNLLKNLTALSR